jgi:hypothetical protein
VTTVAAVVDDVEPFICDEGVLGVEGPPRRAVCASVTARPTEGPETGALVTFDVRAAVVDADIRPGDAVSLLRLPPAAGQAATYTFVEFVRGQTLVLLAASFSVLVVLVARLRGLLALHRPGPQLRPDREVHAAGTAGRGGPAARGGRGRRRR